jgi:hypothetical protein
MNKKVIAVIVGFITILSLLSYSFVNFKINFNKALKDINLSNEKFRIPEVNTENYVNDVPVEYFFDGEYIDALSNKESNNKKSMSKDEALEDIDFFF